MHTCFFSSTFSLTLASHIHFSHLFFMNISSLLSIYIYIYIFLIHPLTYSLSVYLLFESPPPPPPRTFSPCRSQPSATGTGVIIWPTYISLPYLFLSFFFTYGQFIVVALYIFSYSKFVCNNHNSFLPHRQVSTPERYHCIHYKTVFLFSSLLHFFLLFFFLFLSFSPRVRTSFSSPLPAPPHREFIALSSRSLL